MSGARSVLITRNSCMSSPMLETWKRTCPAGTDAWSGVTLNSCSVTLTVVPTGVAVGAGVGGVWRARKHCRPKGRLLLKAHCSLGPLTGCSCAKQKDLRRETQLSDASQFPVAADCVRQTVLPG